MKHARALTLTIFGREPFPRTDAVCPVPVNVTEAPGHRRPELSIVIPAYNEEKRIGGTLECIRRHFAVRPSGLGLNDIEVIVVDDGSVDGTAHVVQNFAREITSLRLVSNGINRGKGYSVRHGTHEARGRIALFMDADLSFSMQEVEKLLAAITAGNDVAIGSRGIDPSLIETHPPLMRKIAGIVFNKLVRLSIGLPFRDTQCGLKAFVRERCRTIFEQQRIERFGFDPEILFLARRQGLRTAEVPVRSSHDPASKVHILRDSVLMFWDLVYIRWNSALNRYPPHDTATKSLTDGRNGVGPVSGAQITRTIYR
jgi:dolichyl-phosphate beta-glucosyltransferase